MSDPVLDAHRVLPRLYLISGGASPISIRDQILRGWLVIDRLRQTAQLSAGRRLLVVGAGAGGATAAITAAGRGIETTLVDAEPAPFGLQRRSATRFLDPTQYDWPVDHWGQGSFSWSTQHVAFPMPFPAAWADQLAMLWVSVLASSLISFPKLLTFRANTRVIDLDPRPSHGKHLRATFGGGTAGDFDTVIWAAGAGRENCQIVSSSKAPVYQGRSFWSTDPLASKNVGVTSGVPKVLICGGGDGGSQDYLRVLTRARSAAFLYAACNIPAEIAARVQSAEDRAHRCRAWIDEDRVRRPLQEHAVFMELEDAHRMAVALALQDPAVRRSLRTLFPYQPPEMCFTYREPYLTSYYGLNRFMTLLVAEHLRRQFGQQTLRPSTVVSSIAPTGSAHVCMVPGPSGGLVPHMAGGAPVCHGQDHDVMLGDAASPTLLSHHVFNVVIVRYGLQDKPLPPLPQPFRKRLALARPRHALPYHQPI